MDTLLPSSAFVKEIVNVKAPQTVSSLSLVCVVFFGTCTILFFFILFLRIHNLPVHMHHFILTTLSICRNALKAYFLFKYVVAVVGHD